MGEHAILSASGAHRWLHCPPSALLEHELPESTSEAADEGTAAHDMAAVKLTRELIRRGETPLLADGERYRTKRTASKYDGPEMERHTDDYVQFITEILDEIKKTRRDFIVLVEHRLDYSRYVPEGFGTADCVIVADGTLHVVDFKYGRGVMVEAEGNPQMRLYALGALDEFDFLYDVEQVSMTIYQPRREHYDTECLTVKELEDWAKHTLKPAAELAIKGKGEFTSGGWCKFCKIGPTCRARAEANLELAKHDFAKPAELDRDEIADVLRQVDELADWAGSVKRYALQLALEGETWPGFKVVEGRSIRRITDEAQFIAEAVGHGLQKDVYLGEPKLRGITDIEKALGKGVFNAYFGKLITKPQGAPALVPETDKRPALNLNDAKSDFALTEDYYD